MRKRRGRGERGVGEVRECDNITDVVSKGF